MKLLVIRSKLTLFSTEAVEIPFDRVEYNMKLKPEAIAECVRWVNSLLLACIHTLSPLLWQMIQPTLNTNESETLSVHSQFTSHRPSSPTLLKDADLKNYHRYITHHSFQYVLYVQSIFCCSSPPNTHTYAHICPTAEGSEWCEGNKLQHHLIFFKQM